MVRSEIQNIQHNNFTMHCYNYNLYIALNKASGFNDSVNRDLKKQQESDFTMYHGA